MKKIILPLLFCAVAAFAVNVQILEPTGADFATNAPEIFKTIARSAVAKTGNTPVEEESYVQLRTNFMTLGHSIMVVCELLDNGNVIGSGQDKAAAVDEMDVVIAGAIREAFANSRQQTQENAYVPAPTTQTVVVYDNPPPPARRPPPRSADDEFVHKKPTRNYRSYGLGIAIWHNWADGSKIEWEPNIWEEEGNLETDWKVSFAFHWAKIFEVSSYAAITLTDNFNFAFKDAFQLHEVFLIGGRYMVTIGSITPFVGAGLGLGLQLDYEMDYGNDFAIGLAAGIEAGAVFFRNSSVQLEVGLTWDGIWDGFDGFGERFGAGTFYVAVNY